MIENDLQNRIHFGDREAFLAVYQEYGPGAYAAAKKALSSDSLAKSAIKQAFLTLYEEILTQPDDFDIPVRIRELTEREITLLRLVSGETSMTDRLVSDGEEIAPEHFSARGAFADQADSLPRLPSLERKRAYPRARKRLFLHAKPRAAASAQTPLVWKILLVLVDLFLLWVLAGMLMGLGYLPVVDLGYSWFSKALHQFSMRFS